MARTDPPRVLMDACALIAIIKDEPGAERLDGLLETPESWGHLACGPLPP